jgi:hypothetical protein
MSNTYADALKYFRTKLKAGSEPEPDPSQQSEFEKQAEPRTQKVYDGLLRERIAEEENLATATAMKVPEVVESPVTDPEFITLPDGTKRRIRPQEPTEVVYEWSHVMDYSSFRIKTPWRQAQLIAQWKENEALGGKHTNLRGKPRNGPCFGSCPAGNCTCQVTEDF